MLLSGKLVDLLPGPGSGQALVDFDQNQSGNESPYMCPPGNTGACRK